MQFNCSLFLIFIYHARDYRVRVRSRYSLDYLERLSEKVLSGVSIAHLAGTQRQNQGCFVSFLDS
jgi:hypothetical protein